MAWPITLQRALPSIFGPSEWKVSEYQRASCRQLKGSASWQICQDHQPKLHALQYQIRDACYLSGHPVKVTFYDMNRDRRINYGDVLKIDASPYERYTFRVDRRGKNENKDELFAFVPTSWSKGTEILFKKDAKKGHWSLADNIYKMEGDYHQKSLLLFVQSLVRHINWEVIDYTSDQHYGPRPCF